MIKKTHILELNSLWRVSLYATTFFLKLFLHNLLHSWSRFSLSCRLTLAFRTDHSLLVRYQYRLATPILLIIIHLPFLDIFI